jgi:hypothetical protein
MLILRQIWGLGFRDHSDLSWIHGIFIIFIFRVSFKRFIAPSYELGNDGPERLALHFDSAKETETKRCWVPLAFQYLPGVEFEFGVDAQPRWFLHHVVHGFFLSSIRGRGQRLAGDDVHLKEKLARL